VTAAAVNGGRQLALLVMSRQNVEHYMRFKDQRKSRPMAQKRLHLVNTTDASK
jgi:hypothetical protein